MPMKLSDKQKQYLRGLAHGLKPVVHIGSAGITPGLLTEFDQNLEHHELLKVKFRVGDRATRDAAINELVERSAAALIGRIGNVAILYRCRKDKPAIVLPG